MRAATLRHVGTRAALVLTLAALAVLAITLLAACNLLVIYLMGGT